MSDVVLYTSEDGTTRLDLRLEGQTVCLTQLEIAELFQTSKQNVSLHAKNILEDGEVKEPVNFGVWRFKIHPLFHLRFV